MSILDKVRQSKFLEEIGQFSPTQTLNSLFARLNSKEREVLIRRFGLFGKPKETLEQIGQSFNLTRERVRQIERLSVKKIREIEELKGEVRKIEKLVGHLLGQHGGLMSQEHFLESFLGYLEESEEHEASLLFLLREVLKDKVEQLKSNNFWNDLWKLKEVEVTFAEQVINELIRIVERNAKPLKFSELLAELRQSEFYQNNKSRFLALNPLLDEADLDQELEKIILTNLRSSKKIKKNLFGEWGLASWGSVVPKRINDKIYLVLKRAGVPLHFAEIARLINEAKFDDKVAYPATTHNELILDEKYVLVGRGIYALREWGYNSGTVSEVIAEILRKSGKPLSRPQIMVEVLKQRQVKPTTVYLALMNKKIFKKVNSSEFALV
ncbi:MAG: sigma factor-like helix-turn-helix DNA-binding protein [Candidatus Buchananbacteria bacterium]